MCFWEWVRSNAGENVMGVSGLQQWEWFLWSLNWIRDLLAAGSVPATGTFLAAAFHWPEWNQFKLKWGHCQGYTLCWALICLSFCWNIGGLHECGRTYMYHRYSLGLAIYRWKLASLKVVAKISITRVYPRSLENRCLAQLFSWQELWKVTLLWLFLRKSTLLAYD